MEQTEEMCAPPLLRELIKAIQKYVTNTEVKKDERHLFVRHCISLNLLTILSKRVKLVMKNVDIFSNRAIMCCRIIIT